MSDSTNYRLQTTNSVRTRFAPSPTGFLHVGNVRAALFPWLVARQAGGKFILRIEDTDQAREVAGAIEVIKSTLNWLGITWDEGPDIGGDFGPYTQTERQDIYLRWAKVLIDKNLAYADARTAAELDELRADAKVQKKAFLSRDYRPENPPTWQPGMPLRFLSDPKAHKWHDAIMGDLSAGPEAVDDFIILKSDGLPTYNFAHIIDDHEMQMTHVIRGLEYISSMPKYLNLYEALEFEKPIFAHAPHIMAPDGNKKLSKRDGAKGILDYKDEGFLPEAILNFLASLGWNDGTEQEIFSVDELIEKFSLERVQRSGARFDEKRLLWMNGHYIREMALDELYERSKDFWGDEANSADDEFRKQVLGVIQERLKFLSEIPGLTSFFFGEPTVDLSLVDDNKQLSKFSHDELKKFLETSRAALEQSDFALDSLITTLNDLLEHTGQKPGVLFSLIRIATTWAPASPDLAQSLELLGKQKVLDRIQKAIDSL